MTRLSFASLRVRLLLLVLLAVLPAFGLSLYTFAEERQLATYQAQQDTLLLLRQASSEQERLIEEIQQILEILAHLPEVQSGDSTMCGKLFSNLLQRNSHYIVFAIAKPDGELFCTVPSASSPLNIADRAYFQRVLKTRDFTVGDYAISRTTSKPTIHFSYPVLGEDGQVKSVLIAGIDLTWLDQLAAEQELPAGTILTVIDRNGTILSRYPDSEKWVGKSVTEAPIVQAVLNRQGEGKFESVGIDGIPRLYAFRSLFNSAGRGDVYIYAGIPFDSAFAGANRMLARNLAGLGLITALILAIAWAGSNRFVIRRVDCLLGATQQFAAGDLSARTGLTYDKGELGQLAHSFDKMAEALSRDITERKQMENALRESEEKYRAIFENTGTATAIIEEDTTISLANTELEKLTGYSKEEVEGKKSWKEFVSKDDLYRLKEYHHARRADPGAAPGNYEFRLVDRQGNVRDIFATMAMIPGTKKSVASLLDITERKRTEAAIQRRLALEETIARISSRFVGQSNINDAINASLADMGILRGASRAYLFLFREDKVTMDNTHEWCAMGVSPQIENLQNLPVGMFPWWMSKLRKGEIIYITDVSKMPAEARSEQEILESQEIKSILVLPINVRGNLAGFIGFDNVIGTGEWHSDDLVLLRISSEIIGSAFERKLAEDRIRRDAARAQAMAEISQALTEAGLDYQAVLDTVARRTADLIGDASVVCLLSDDGQWLNPVAFHHSNPAAFDMMRKLLATSPVRVDGGPFDRVLQTSQTLLINSASPEQMGALTKPEYWSYLDCFGISNFLLAPLRLQGGLVIGALSLSRDNPGRPYTADDQAFLQDLADRVALVIANSRLYSKNLRQLKTIRALYTSAQKLGQSLNIKELAEDITRTCVEAFGVRLAWLGRAEEDGRVRLLASYPVAGLLDPLGVHWDDSPLGQGAVGRAIRTGSSVIITDIASDPNYAPWRDAALEQGFCCAAGFPLISRNKSFSGLLLYSDQPGFFAPERVEFLQAYAHQAAAAMENARLFEEAQRRYEHLQALRSIDMAITAGQDLRDSLNVVLDQVTAQLEIDAADILQLNKHTQTLEYVAGRGFRSKSIERSRLRLGEGCAGCAALERRIIHIENLPEWGDALTRARLLAGEGFITCYGVPLIAKGQVKGVLEIFHRSPLDAGQEWLDFLETLAGQAAIAIDNAELFDGLQRSNIELTMAYDATIEGLSYALDLRDKETDGHSKRVTEMTVRLARTMGTSEAELVHMRRGALLHDIGKMGIPDHILLKPGPLTDEEWEIMRLHPVYAFEMLSPIEHLRPALDIPYCHHEKWDGTGYPRGLKGEQIPLAARIFAVVDVWDALHSDRPYRPAWPEDKVREYIREQAGKHFDPKVVKVFLEME
ncbi:MAG: GAF domain-containing protein [Bacillota bacterium]